MAPTNHFTSLPQTKTNNLTQHVTKTSSGSDVVSYVSDLGPDTTVLTLVHGYPQSSFEWRYIIPELSGKVSLFVPELPGYGVSTPTNSHSKRDVGSALLEALSSIFNATSSSPRKIILGGHDRGARVCHRLVVDKARYPQLNVLGAIFLDIVPTKVQWEAGANPKISSGYFHWPLLANVKVGVALVKAFGGGQWCRGLHSGIGGSNEKGKQRIHADGAVDIYAANFEREDVLLATAEDYAAGAGVDIDEQTDDQKNGRKVEVPLLVMFSKAKLGATQDVENVWRDWVKDGVEYEGFGVGGGYGHFLPEEAHDIVAPKFLDFISKHA